MLGLGGCGDFGIDCRGVRRHAEAVADERLRPCDATHSNRTVAKFPNLRPPVSGTAVILDDCTVRVDDFVYDGTRMMSVSTAGRGDFTGGFR